jgi:hypothetical protein
LLPLWLTELAQRTGPVVYDDPQLALRVRLTRLMVIETAAAGLWLALAERRRFAQALRGLIYQQTDAINLAIFRIVVFRQIYDTCYFDFIVRIATLPSGLQYPPLTGMLGFCSRASAGLTAVLFLLAWGRLQWYGKVDHHHHLLWFAVLLAASPSGDALSVDRMIAMLRGKSSPAPGPRYGMPIGFSMLLMGVIYLFPGLWKICRSGLDWAWSDSPKMMLQREWRMYGDWLPAFRFDRYPLLYRGGSLAALLFELAFVWMLLGRRTRIVAAALGAGFHLATYATLNIEFETLRNCYVLFIDWGGLLKRLTGGPSSDSTSVVETPRPFAASAIAGTLLLAGNVWAGAMRMTDGWPFACYPQFDGLSEPYYRSLKIVVTLRDGSGREIAPDEYRDVFGNRWNNLLQRILNTSDEVEKAKRLGIVWQVLGRTEGWVEEAQSVQFYSVRSFVDPERWSEEPDDPQLLYQTEVQA